MVTHLYACNAFIDEQGIFSGPPKWWISTSQTGGKRKTVTLRPPRKRRTRGKADSIDVSKKGTDTKPVQTKRPLLAQDSTRAKAFCLVHTKHSILEAKSPQLGIAKLRIYLHVMVQSVRMPVRKKHVVSGWMKTELTLLRCNEIAFHWNALDLDLDWLKQLGCKRHRFSLFDLHMQKILPCIDADHTIMPRSCRQSSYLRIPTTSAKQKATPCDTECLAVLGVLKLLAGLYFWVFLAYAKLPLKEWSP